MGGLSSGIATQLAWVPCWIAGLDLRGFPFTLCSGSRFYELEVVRRESSSQRLAASTSARMAKGETVSSTVVRPENPVTERANTVRATAAAVVLSFLLKGLVGCVGADIRASELLFLRCACPTSLLCFFYVFEPGSLLRPCWFFTLRNIGPVFRLKYVSLNMLGLCS